MAKSKRLDLILGAKDRASRPVGGVGRALGGLKTKILALGAAVGAGLSVGAVVSFAKGSVAAFMEQEQAVENLRTALKLAGDENASTLQDMREFASALQEQTTQGDEATLQLAAYVSQLSGLAGKELQSATAATLGLSRATGQGAEIMGRAYLNALEGNFTSLQRYVPELRSATTEAEKMAIVQDLASKGLTMMSSDAGTTRGAVQQMKNTWGDFREMIGSKLAPIIVSLSGRFKGLVEQVGPRISQFVGNLIERVVTLVGVVGPKVAALFTTVFRFIHKLNTFFLPTVLARFGVVKQLVLTIVDIVKTAGSAIMGVIRSIFPSMGRAGEMAVGLRDLVTKSLITVEFGLKNWKQVVELVFLGASLSVVKFVNQVVHFFTDVIPGVLIWLGNNWRTILADVMNLSRTMFENMASNAVSVLKNLPGLITGEVSFSDLWRPLTDGFEITLSELPQIAKRQEGELERMLRQQVAEVGGGLAGGLGQFMEERLAEINTTTSLFDGLFDFSDDRGFFSRLRDRFKDSPLDLSTLIGDGAGAGISVPVSIEKPPKGSAAEKDLKSIVQQQVSVDALQVSRRFLGLASLANSRAQQPQEKTASNTDAMRATLDKLKAVAEKQLEVMKQPVGAKLAGVTLPR